MINYELVKSPRLIFGRGSSVQTGERLKELDVEKALIITDKSIVSLGLVDRVLDSIKEQDIQCDVFDEVMPEPTDAFCLELAGRLKKEKYDAVVAVGGGSPIDTAKAATLIEGIPDEIEDLHDYGGTGTKMKNSYRRPCFYFALPTTSGTGAESTHSAVLTSALHGMKYSFMNPNMGPDLAIVDPDFTIGMPAGPTAVTGIDAFCHAVENVVGVGKNDFTNLILYEVISRIWKWLPVAYKDTQNVEAREQMSWAAHNALANGGSPNGHAIGHAIGSTYHIVHGQACAMVLPSVIRHFAETAQEEISRLAQIMGVEISGNAREDAERVAEAITGFCRSLGIKSVKDTFAEKRSQRSAISLLPRTIYTSPSQR